MSSTANQLLQQAGQNLHSAIVALANASQASNAELTELVYNNPTAADASRVLGTFTASVQLGKDLSELDARLRKIYEVASGALPAASVPLLGNTPKTEATDVVAKVTVPEAIRGRGRPAGSTKPAAKATKPVAKASKPAAKAAKVAKPAAAPVAAKAEVVAEPAKVAAKPVKFTGKKASKVAAEKPKKLAGNAEKVLNYLKTVLNTETPVKVIQAAIAAGSGLPNGSVAASLTVLKNFGAIKETKKGEFKLVPLAAAA